MKNSDDDKKKKPDKKNNSDNKNNTSTASNQGTVSGQKPTTLDYFKYYVQKVTVGVDDDNLVCNRKRYYEEFKDLLKDDNQKRIYRDYSEPLIQKISDLKTERTKLKKDLETWQKDNSKYTSNFTYKNRGNHEVEINRQIDKISEQIDSLHNSLLLMQAIFYHENIDETELTNQKLDKMKESLERFISGYWRMGNILKQFQEKFCDHDVCHESLQSNLLASITALKDAVSRNSADRISTELGNFNERVDKAIQRLTDDLGCIESIEEIFSRLEKRLEEMAENQRKSEKLNKSPKIISPEKKRPFECDDLSITLGSDLSRISHESDSENSDERSFDEGVNLKNLNKLRKGFNDTVEKLEKKLENLKGLKQKFEDSSKNNGLSGVFANYKRNGDIATFKKIVNMKISPSIEFLKKGLTKTYENNELKKYTPVITTDTLGLGYLPLPWVWLCAINQLPIDILRYMLEELPDLDVNLRSAAGDHPVKTLVLDGALDKAALLIPYALEFNLEDIYDRASEQIKFLEDLSAAEDTENAKKIGEYLFGKGAIRDTIFIHFNQNTFWIDIYAQPKYQKIAEKYFNYRYTPDSPYNPDSELAHIPFWARIILANYQGLNVKQCQNIIGRYCNGDAIGLIQEIAEAARKCDPQVFTDQIPAAQDPRLVNMAINLSGLIVIPNNVDVKNSFQDLLKHFDTLTTDSIPKFLSEDVEDIFNSKEASISYIMRNAKKLRCDQSTLRIQEKIVSYSKAPKEVAQKKPEEPEKKDDADKKPVDNQGGGLQESLNNVVYYTGVIFITGVSLYIVVYLMDTWLSHRYGRALSKEREKEMKKMLEDMGESYTFVYDGIYKKVNPKSLEDSFASLYEEEKDDDQDGDDENPLKEHKPKSSKPIRKEDVEQEESVLSPNIDNPEEKVEAPSLMSAKHMVQVQEEGGELSNGMKEPDIMIFPDIIILPSKTVMAEKEVATSHSIFAVGYGSDVGVGVYEAFMLGGREEAVDDSYSSMHDEPNPVCYEF